MNQDPEDQIILIDKPTGISSFGVVAKVRGFLKAKYGHKVKVGHTGTLDPFATGLLIILSGKMTKKSNDFLKLDKVYEATMKLGYTSTTGDPEGEIREYIPTQFDYSSSPLRSHPSSLGSLASCSPSVANIPQNNLIKPDLHDIESTLTKFTGKITQTPPKYSAIKINGQRAYKLARQNKDFEIPSRQVEIYKIEILDYHYPELTIRCHVSSGTYIRTLAEDIGNALNTGAYLTKLRRLQIGQYNIKDSQSLTNYCNKD